MKKITLLFALLISTAGFSQAAPTTNAPTPPTRNSVDVFSIYSDSYANVTGANYNPNWTQSGYNDVVVDYNPTGVTGDEINTVIAYTNFNYQGIEFATSDSTQDLSNMEYLHIDVYSATSDAFLKVFTIRNNAGAPQEFAVDIPLVYNGWSSVDLPKGDFTGLTWDTLYQLKLDGTSPSDIYVDNIYFWKAPTDVSTDASLSDLTVDGSTVTGFSSQTLSYDVELPVGTTVVPTVVGTPTQTTASAAATNAPQLPGASTVVVTAADGTTQQTYTINFTVSTGLSDYCDTEVLHLSLQDQTASAINLTIENTGPSTMKLTASHADIDYLQLDAGTTGNPTQSSVNTSVAGEISITLTWTEANVPNGDVSFGNILWEKSTIGGRWQLNAGTVVTSFVGVCATAGIEDILANSVKMYPNPAKGVVNFSSASNAALDVSVYDMLGKQVLRAEAVQSQLNISSLNPGMYFVKMTQGSNSATKKLVVK